MKNFVITRQDEENIEITLNGKFVASANHDSDGWAGMETLEDAVKRIGEILNIPVIEG